ncbi:putative TetR family transcriptional regulator [Gordonia hirsuta DSM 44140 = NBRC 16056]|uniref:Putative TetR family transcriptional regulator n=1 Tax=Gordonia hirsuta DSM 44140 = NBRC 16056 TaxID=1121927 RepID=L7LBF8_9ACTN|nr:hypothetical protein [Gordonia hirsuta]GAC58264.1 putative TetR family transcriptional regulator [Gordonia hirsuta DSM 44140 = NBRC 16056]
MSRPAADRPGDSRSGGNRRDQLITAAADLLRTGDGKITHRMVAERAGVPLGSTTYYFATLDDLMTAGLEHLADEVDRDLEYTEQLLAASDRRPETVARLLHQYLSDGDRVRTEIALYVAAVQRPELVGLTRRWFDGLVQILSTLTDPAAARMMAVFVDGASLHAALHEQALDSAVIENLARTLMNRPADPARSEHP